jgi:hypothetical protein
MREELRVQIGAVQDDLRSALQSGSWDEVRLRRARLLDLVEMASRHGVDVSDWVDRSLLGDEGEDR